MKNMIVSSSITLTSIFALSAQASIIINEIDYDQVGADTAEFIELFNNGSDTVALDGYSIQLINGADGSTYRNIDLGGFSLGASDYFVVCDDTTKVANCNFDFSTTSGWLQNGAPDAIALSDSVGIIDSISYEGQLQPYTEGNVLSIEDSNNFTVSIARIPNGFDSNDNLADFQQGCITPGTANIAGTGDCTSLAVNAVPLPAAVWMFGSGILGLVGVARRQHRS
jgi:Lamin Tail Domain